MWKGLELKQSRKALYTLAHRVNSRKYYALIASLGFGFIDVHASDRPLTGCSLDQFKTEAAQVPQLISATLGEPTTFNYPLNDSAYSVFGFLYDGLLTENGLTGELEPCFGRILGSCLKISSELFLTYARG